MPHNVIARMRSFVARHIRVSRPAAETTGLMVGAAFVVFVVLLALRLDLWVWVERASWVIALVLFPAAIYQLVVLQRDQRRLADEITKQPDVRVGLRIQTPPSLPGIDPQLMVPVHWQADVTMSDPVKLPLSAVNVGERTAHNVLINLVFPKHVQLVVGPPASQMRDESEFDRWRLMPEERGTLHIGVTVDLTVTVRVAAELDHGFPIRAEVSTEDRPYITSMLWVRYESPKEKAEVTA